MEEAEAPGAVSKQMHPIGDRPSRLSICQLSVLMECRLPASHSILGQREVLS